MYVHDVEYMYVVVNVGVVLRPHALSVTLECDDVTSP